MPFVLSHFTVEPLIAARREGAISARISLDLGLTESVCTREPSGVRLPDGELLPWAAVEEIAATESACFAIEAGEARKVQFYSEELQRFYSLYPTRRAPTMMLSGIPMHRIK